MAIGRSVAVGIDIGTSGVKVIVSEGDPRNERAFPRVLGTGYSESKGLRHGYITNLEETVKSIRAAVSQAEKSSGVPIRKAYVAIGGVGVSAIVSNGAISTTKADSEITELDIKRAWDESEKELPQAFILNRKIIHTVPLEYRIDGKKVLGRPQGMKGVRLEAKVLYITCLGHHLNDILLAFEEADIEVEDVVASPMAASLVTLNKTQKIAGCILANIGSETTSIIVYENNIPVSMEIFPFGSNDVTNDIALGLKIPIDEAEQVKVGTGKMEGLSKRKLEEIIIARLSDIFDLIEDHLRRIDRSGLLPAGIILTGGGSGLSVVEELAKLTLKLPAKRHVIKFEGNTKSITRDYEWAVAYGLTMLGLSTEQDSGGKLGFKFAKKAKNSIWGWIKQFLP
ncbi:MAG: hypothetical protein RL094_617 [Candidatus Parcubacteria bacterium]|jgi:cell division protein FtsA